MDAHLSYRRYHLRLSVTLAHRRRHPTLIQSTQQLHELGALRDERANDESLTRLIMSSRQLCAATHGKLLLLLGKQQPLQQTTILQLSTIITIRLSLFNVGSVKKLPAQFTHPVPPT